MQPEEKLLNVKETGVMLGIKTKTVYQLVHERRIPYVKLFGKSLRFKLSDLQRIVDESTTPVQEF